MLAPISKWAQSIYSVHNVAEVMRKAFKVAETEKPGVCVFELPEHVAKQDVVDKPMRVTRVRKPVADHKAIAEVVELIGAAKRPIILAGNGAVRKRATAAATPSGGENRHQCCKHAYGYRCGADE